MWRMPKCRVSIFGRVGRIRAILCGECAPRRTALRYFKGKSFWPRNVIIASKDVLVTVATSVRCVREGVRNLSRIGMERSAKCRFILQICLSTKSVGSGMLGVCKVRITNVASRSIPTGPSTIRSKFGIHLKLRLNPLIEEVQYSSESSWTPVNSHLGGPNRQ